jgi:hypothetical protein
MSTQDEIIRALMTVPEKKLKIIEIIKKVPIIDGHLDYAVVSEMAAEIKVAEDEADAYGKHTTDAVKSLMECRALGES